MNLRLTASPRRASLAVAMTVGFACGASAWTACSNPSGEGTLGTTCPATVSTGDAGAVAIANDAGMALKPFVSSNACDPGAGAVYVTISGESNALTGYPFPPGDFSQDTYMYDGWQFEIDKYIVVVDK